MPPKRPNVRGALDAFLPKDAPAGDAPGTRLSLAVEDLLPNRFQPRRSFDEGSLASLAASIKMQGVLQPLLVRALPSGFEIGAGERRWRAARLAGLAKVPVEVCELTDVQAVTVAAIENLQRENLDVIDEVDSMVTIVAQRLGIAREEVRTTLNVLLRNPQSDPDKVRELELTFGEVLSGSSWQSFAKNKLRILRWPEPVLVAMREHGLGYSLAGIVAAAPAEQQADLLEIALAGASQAELRAEMQRRSFQKEHEGGTRRAREVAKLLGSSRRVEALDKKRQKQLQKLLTQIDALFTS